MIREEMKIDYMCGCIRESESEMKSNRLKFGTNLVEQL